VRFRFCPIVQDFNYTNGVRLAADSRHGEAWKGEPPGAQERASAMTMQMDDDYYDYDFDDDWDYFKESVTLAVDLDGAPLPLAVTPVKEWTVHNSWSEPYVRRTRPLVLHTRAVCRYPGLA
jgi:hypothetical protein